jgi:hypothetical protein
MKELKKCRETEKRMRQHRVKQVFKKTNSKKNYKRFNQRCFILPKKSFNILRLKVIYPRKKDYGVFSKVNSPKLPLSLQSVIVFCLLKMDRYLPPALTKSALKLICGVVKPLTKLESLCILESNWFRSFNRH